MKKGKLIVIDGSDGSGKATQAKELARTLKKQGCKVRTLDFPQYENNHFGKLIKECLNGERGDFVGMDPRIASVLYAADRFESRTKIMKWLAEGCIVILDRYVSSNQIHQGGKIASLKKRAAYVAWQEHMEYMIFDLPQPAIVIFLEVPIATAKKLLDNSGKTQDETEKDIVYLRRSLRCAQQLAEQSDKWEKITCTHRAQMRAISDIHEEIVHLLKTKKIIK